MFIFHFECFTLGEKKIESSCSCFFPSPRQMDLRHTLIVTVSSLSSSFSKRQVLVINNHYIQKIISKIFNLGIVD